MKSLITEIIGTYTPVTTGEGIGTVDFAYVFAGIIFCIAFYQTFKFIYGLFMRT